MKRSLSHLWELIFNCFNEETLATCEFTDIARVSFDELHRLLAGELSYTEWPSSEVGSPWADVAHAWPGPREMMEQYELLASRVRQEYLRQIRCLRKGGRADWLQLDSCTVASLPKMGARLKQIQRSWLSIAQPNIIRVVALFVGLTFKC